MAEERLFDDDKDRKYKIKVNENGEEELIIDVSGEEEQAPEVTLSDYPEDEEPRIQTEEQLEELRRQQEAEKKEREEKASILCDRAAKDCRSAKFATALDSLESAEELCPEMGEIYALRLIAYTKNFTDFTQITKAAEGADKMAENLDVQRKEELYKISHAKIEANVTSLRNEITALDKQNEEKKAERKEKFTKDRNTALIYFAVALVLFIGFAATAIYYSTIIFSVNTGEYITYTAVFGVLSVIALIGVVIAARFLITACRRLSLNKRNISTQLGRDLIAKQANLKAFLAINAALKTK